MRVPPSRSNCLPKVPSPNTILLVVRISTYESGQGVGKNAVHRPLLLLVFLSPIRIKELPYVMLVEHLAMSSSSSRNAIFIYFSPVETEFPQAHTSKIGRQSLFLCIIRKSREIYLLITKKDPPDFKLYRQGRRVYPPTHPHTHPLAIAPALYHQMIFLMHILMESATAVLCKTCTCPSWEAALRLLFYSRISLSVMPIFRLGLSLLGLCGCDCSPPWCKIVMPKQTPVCHPWNSPSLYFFLVPGRDLTPRKDSFHLLSPPNKVFTPSFLLREIFMSSYKGFTLY